MGTILAGLAIVAVVLGAAKMTMVWHGRRQSRKLGRAETHAEQLEEAAKRRRKADAAKAEWRAKGGLSGAANRVLAKRRKRRGR